MTDYTDDSDTDDDVEAVTYGKYNEYDNVYDFIEYKMHRLIDYAAKHNREDVATSFYEALEEYMLGNIDIVFVAGWPHTYMLVDAADIVE